MFDKLEDITALLNIESMNVARKARYVDTKAREFGWIRGILARIPKQLNQLNSPRIQVKTRDRLEPELAETCRDLGRRVERLLNPYLWDGDFDHALDLEVEQIVKDIEIKVSVDEIAAWLEQVGDSPVPIQALFLEGVEEQRQWTEGTGLHDLRMRNNEACDCGCQAEAEDDAAERVVVAELDKQEGQDQVEAVKLDEQGVQEEEAA